MSVTGFTGFLLHVAKASATWGMITLVRKGTSSASMAIWARCSMARTRRHELELSVPDPSRMLLLGGLPFEERLLM